LIRIFVLLVTYSFKDALFDRGVKAILGTVSYLPTGKAGLTHPLQDFEFRLEFDIEEDIEGELEYFVQLARLGLAQEARETFDHSLRDHLRLFPVLAEYSEFLLAENKYRELSKILLTAMVKDDFSEGERWLLELLRGLSDFHTTGHLDGAFYTAREWQALVKCEIGRIGWYRGIALQSYFSTRKSLSILDPLPRIVSHNNACWVLTVASAIVTGSCSIPKLQARLSAIQRFPPLASDASRGRLTFGGAEGHQLALGQSITSGLRKTGPKRHIHTQWWR
jgi:hypothetical protein